MAELGSYLDISNNIGAKVLEWHCIYCTKYQCYSAQSLYIRIGAFVYAEAVVQLTETRRQLMMRPLRLMTTFHLMIIPLHHRMDLSPLPLVNVY